MASKPTIYYASKTLERFHSSDALVRGAMGCIGCLSGDALVVTAEGPQRIDSLTESTRVLSWDEKLDQFRLVQASASFLKGRDVLYRVQTPHGEWRAAGHHRVLCADGKYRQVQSLSLGQSLLRCSSPPPKGVRSLWRKVLDWMDPQPVLKSYETLQVPPCEHPSTMDYQTRREGRADTACQTCEALYLRRNRGDKHSLTKESILSIDMCQFQEEYWDIQVPGTNNYVTVDGTIHHNSGKSVAMCQEIFTRALQQKPDAEGLRRTKWVVVRNTYRELMDTTIKTWFEWFPENMGIWKKMDLEHHFRLPGGEFIDGEYKKDGTITEFSVIFRALDTPQDIKKLLSLEVTGGWINEAREIPRAILRAMVGRRGRFPPKDKVSGFGGATWSGIIMDTNPPDDDHWWYTLFEEEKPDKYELFQQPSGLSPEAENIENLPDNYYEDMLLGNNQEYINVYVHGKYGHIEDGMPVYPEFNDDFHVAKEFIKYNPDLNMWVGIDFGRTPAAEFAQQGKDGQWRFIDEITTTNMGAVEFADVLGGKLRRDYRDNIIRLFGDPAGDDRGQVDDRTPFDVLYAAGIEVLASPSQDPVIRREAFAKQMTGITYASNPKLLISPKCKMLRKGLNGGFKYKRVQVSGEERYKNEPDKNRFSHPVEAAEYLLVGAGEDVTHIGNEEAWANLNRQHLDRAAG